MGRVSVIIPAYNVAGSLKRCLDSVLAQSLQPNEIVVIDDGSTDETAAAAQAYGDTVTYIHQSNQGQGAARNRGLEVVTGDYVALLDADDYWLPTFLEQTVLFLEAHAEAVAVSCAFQVCHARGRTVVGPPCCAGGVRDPEPVVLDDFFAFWAEQDHVRTGTALIRKSIIDEAGGQRADLRISQDLEYWGYLATFGPWGFISEPLWVGNSRMAAKQSGWQGKYKKRRALCPTVEAWQARVLPRLDPTQHHHFFRVRGRVAAGYAHAKIIGGDRKGALHIVREYASDLPGNRVTRLLKLGQRSGPVGWFLACAIVRARERVK